MGSLEGIEIGISVNASAYQLGRDGFAEDVRRTLHESGIEPPSLTLEITETALMRNVPVAWERLKEIRALGVRIAIDDFGTGYASLSSLQRMPVDILKIDTSFVAALNDGGQSRELLMAVLGGKGAVARRGRRGHRGAESADHARRHGLQEGAGIPLREAEPGGGYRDLLDPSRRVERLVHQPHGAPRGG